MAKLPSNLVTAPKFDSPFRRTEAPPLEVPATPVVDIQPLKSDADTVEPVPSADVPKPRKGRAKKPSSKSSPAAAPEEKEEELLLHRLSCRLTDQQSEALEKRVFQLRMAGEKVNSAALVRRILNDWIERAPASP